MSAKATLSLALALSLFFSTQVYPVTAAPVGTTQGKCAKMACTMGCCKNKACCAAAEEHRAPQPVRGQTNTDLDVAAMRPLNLEPFYFLPPAARSIAIRDDAQTGHAPPQLALNCIRLI